MCGITGIFDTRGQRPVEQRVLQRMNDSQQHRGPDEGSLHIEPDDCRMSCGGERCEMLCTFPRAGNESPAAGR